MLRGSLLSYYNTFIFIDTYLCPSSQTVAGSSVIVTDTTLQENTDVSSPMQSGLIAGIVAVIAFLISAGVVLPLIILYSLRKKLNANDRAAYGQDGMDNKVYGKYKWICILDLQRVINSYITRCLTTIKLDSFFNKHNIYTEISSMISTMQDHIIS